MSEDPRGEYRIVQTALFKQRHAEHIKAKADLEGLDQAAMSDKDYERQHRQLAQHLEDTERLLMTTHAREDWIIIKKVEVLEATMTEDATSPFLDRRALWMLAAIKADLCASAGGLLTS